jgi:hypothetical protein
VVLGALSGALVLVLTSANVPLALRLGLLAVGLITAKMREATLRNSVPENKPIVTPQVLECH